MKLSLPRGMVARLRTFSPAVLAVGIALGTTPCASQSLEWSTVANNADEAPGGTAATFRSFSQPAINASELVVFRARSSAGMGGGGAQFDGIYSRDLSAANPIVKLLVRDDIVPAPNNTFYQGDLAGFIDFPSTPRIDASSALVATAGQHQPVWTYQLGESDTKVGTAGLYAFPAGFPVTAASQLGAVVEPDQITLSFPQFSVPGTIAGTRFDQFPGSPAAFDGQFVAFKGNHTDPTDGLGRTGVYYRDIVSTDPVRYTGLIANSNMLIPNQAPDGMVLFGSTAPPSAANGYVFFRGLDNEDAPTFGGIYRAHIPTAPVLLAQPQLATPPLEVLVGIGDQVPGEAPDEGFRSFGEALSVSSDGRRVAFWASWGTDTFPKTLYCPTDGDADLIAYCNSLYPSGLAVNVPVHQGIFVHDADTSETIRVARTGDDGVQDLLYWVFSGQPPGVGGGDPGTELARWRSSAFAALDSPAGGSLQVAFKAQRDDTDGIYLREAWAFQYQLPLVVVAEVGSTDGVSIDPAAPPGSLVSAVGVERDGFRNGHLAIAASMLYVIDPETSVGWAGVYAAPIPLDIVFRDGFEG